MRQVYFIQSPHAFQCLGAPTGLGELWFTSTLTLQAGVKEASATIATEPVINNDNVLRFMLFWAPSLTHATEMKENPDVKKKEKVRHDINDHLLSAKNEGKQSHVFSDSCSSFVKIKCSSLLAEQNKTFKETLWTSKNYAGSF